MTPDASRQAHRQRSPPTGTVTFLFTDVEGSTRRWEALYEEGAAMTLEEAIACLLEGTEREEAGAPRLAASLPVPLPFGDRHTINPCRAE